MSTSKAKTPPQGVQQFDLRLCRNLAFRGDGFCGRGCTQKSDYYSDQRNASVSAQAMDNDIGFSSRANAYVALSSLHSPDHVHLMYLDFSFLCGFIDFFRIQQPTTYRSMHPLFSMIIYSRSEVAYFNAARSLWNSARVWDSCGAESILTLAVNWLHALISFFEQSIPESRVRVGLPGLFPFSGIKVRINKPNKHNAQLMLIYLRIVKLPMIGSSFNLPCAAKTIPIMANTPPATQIKYAGIKNNQNTIPIIDNRKAPTKIKPTTIP